ncbi:MAG: helix-turn-helix domain-containing protein [Ruminococcus sp.]|nr:helix-turn-helix domain-containing protein [Ruminococcus sp.]MCM1382189.1 helix-turn-helix domain-containing protein [Muribaculaceae bacterium]MCM1480638.1 helix-turn-helix domain-containing protein [Muribaculaceae bacterium]
MTVEIADRLQQLRKNNNLSQEELAEKIGVSRQAVSKWERAEASPDTDNLILLSRLYNMSLDELLGVNSAPVSLKKEGYADPVREMRPENYTEEEIYPNRKFEENNSIPQGSPFGADIGDEERRKTSPNTDFGEIGKAVEKAGRAVGDALNAAGDRVREEMKRPGRNGKTFEDRLENSMTKIGKGIERASAAAERHFDKLCQKMEDNEAKYSREYSFDRNSQKQEKYDRKQRRKDRKKMHKNRAQKPPMSLFDKLLPIFVVGTFLSCAAVGLAHPGWVLFLILPLYYTTINALRQRNILLFCYPLLCAVVYFGIGGCLDRIWWHMAEYWYSIMWLLFLTIPLFYTGIVAFRRRNPLIFCYPVLCAVVYLFFGLILEIVFNSEWWLAVAWAPLALSIPIYYIVIDHYRKKRNNIPNSAVSNQ